MPKITTKAKRQERDDAEKVAWGLLKLTTEERLEYLLDPKGAKKKRKGGGVVGSEAPSSDTAAASPGSAKKQKKAENIPASSNVSQTSPAGGPRDDVSDDGTLVEGPIRDQDTGEWLCPKCRRKDVRKALVRCSAKTTCMQYLCAIHDDDIICKGSRGSDDLVFVCDKHAVSFIHLASDCQPRVHKNESRLIDSNLFLPSANPQLKQHLTCQGCESIICLAPECPASTSTTRPGCAKWTCQRKEHRLCGECLDNTEMKKNKDAPCPYCASSEA